MGKRRDLSSPKREWIRGPMFGGKPILHRHAALWYGAHSYKHCGCCYQLVELQEPSTGRMCIFLLLLHPLTRISSLAQFTMTAMLCLSEMAAPAVCLCLCVMAILCRSRRSNPLVERFEGHWTEKSGIKTRQSEWHGLVGKSCSMLATQNP